MARIIRRTLPAALVAALALSISGPGAALGRILPGGSIGGKFPSPPAIQENVKFWRDVFARYKITEVVYHDEVHLDRRYAVLRLAGPWKGTQAQKKRIRAYKEKIRAVLRALAEDRTPPAGPLSARIRKIFSDRPRAELWDALYQIRAQPGLRERFREGYIRSGRYLAHFRRIFRKRGLPEDLILLPHVESGFRSQIYSHAGALGLWQFIRSTARLFVRVDGTMDARRDPFLAAEAAAKLLARNYEDLKNWPLAITAYNHGSVGMRRAVRQFGTRRIGLIVKKYKSRTFGFASRNFYAEFLAAVDVHKNARKYFGPLQRDPPMLFDEFYLPQYIRLGPLARRIGVDIGILRRLNPALRRPVLWGRRSVPRGYPLRLPPGQKGRVLKAYYRAAPGARAARVDDGSRWILVRPGDTLGGIARRHRVRLENLMAENGLRKSLIRVGDRLRLPSGKRIAAAWKFPRSRSKKKSARKLTARRLMAQVPKLGWKAAIRKEIRAREARFRVPALPSSAAPGNPALSAGAGAGSTGRVPDRGSKIREEALRQALAVQSLAGGSGGWVRVQENETIGHFSRWLELSPARLRRMNGIRSNRKVRMGKRIRLSFLSVPKSDFIQRRTAYHKKIEKSFFAKFTVSRVKRHRLKRGENLWTLLVKTYKVPLWLVRRYNSGKKLRRIAAGDELAIPVVRRR
ncbi:MAG: transglycosylase SLT domain-containing protein [Nitrospinota bacterium]